MEGVKALSTSSSSKRKVDAIESQLESKDYSSLLQVIKKKKIEQVEDSRNLGIYSAEQLGGGLEQIRISDNENGEVLELEKLNPMSDAEDTTAVLTDEVLIHIFSFLSVFDLFQTSLVSHLWRRVSSDVHLLRTFLKDQRNHQKIANQLCSENIDRYTKFLYNLCQSRDEEAQALGLRSVAFLVSFALTLKTCEKRIYALIPRFFDSTLRVIKNCSNWNIQSGCEWAFEFWTQLAMLLSTQTHLKKSTSEEWQEFKTKGKEAWDEVSGYIVDSLVTLHPDDHFEDKSDPLPSFLWFHEGENYLRSVIFAPVSCLVEWNRHEDLLSKTVLKRMSEFYQKSFSSNEDWRQRAAACIIAGILEVVPRKKLSTIFRKIVHQIMKLPLLITKRISVESKTAVQRDLVWALYHLLQYGDYLVVDSMEAVNEIINSLITGLKGDPSLVRVICTVFTALQKLPGQSEEGILHKTVYDHLLLVLEREDCVKEKLYLSAYKAIGSLKFKLFDEYKEIFPSLLNSLEKTICYKEFAQCAAIINALEGPQYALSLLVPLANRENGPLSWETMDRATDLILRAIMLAESPLTHISTSDRVAVRKAVSGFFNTMFSKIWYEGDAESRTANIFNKGVSFLLESLAAPGRIPDLNSIFYYLFTKHPASIKPYISQMMEVMIKQLQESQFHLSYYSTCLKNIVSYFPQEFSQHLPELLLTVNNYTKKNFLDISSLSLNFQDLDQIVKFHNDVCLLIRTQSSSLTPKHKESLIAPYSEVLQNLTGLIQTSKKYKQEWLWPKIQVTTSVIMQLLSDCFAAKKTE